MTHTTTPLPDAGLLAKLKERISGGDDYARQLEEAVKTWESLDESPSSLLDVNDTVLLTETPLNIPWPTRPVKPEPVPIHAELFAILPDPVVVLDAEGLIKFWSKAAEEQFGWLSIEVLGKLPPFVSVAQWADHSEIVAAARKDSPIRERIVARKLKDQRTRTFSLHTARTASGDVAMIFRLVEPAKAATVSDTANPLPTRLSVLGQMTASVAHDFNNVLTAICGSADLLADKTPVYSSSREWIEVIRTAGKHAAGLTRRLLNAAKSKAASDETTEISQSIEELLPLIHALVPAGVRVKAQLEPSLPQALAEPTVVEQIVLNLCTNAGQAMPRGGVLQLRTSERIVDDKNYILLAIADSGGGMDESVRAKIFEPYYTTRNSGTGLGLATVKYLIQQIGGKIELDSHPGLGSVFRLFFPASKDRTVLHDGLGKTAMVVDDDAGSRELIKRTLESVGFDVCEAATAEEAIQAAKWIGTIDLLVTDVVMPGLNGRRLADRLRGENANLPVVFVSAYANAESDKPAKAEFLAKPFKPRELLATLRSVLA